MKYSEQYWEDRLMGREGGGHITRDEAMAELIPYKGVVVLEL